MNRRWTWALRVSALAVVAPFWCVKFLPFADMPEQVAVMSSLRHWFDPAFRVQEYFVFTPGKSQYVLYHLLGAALTVVLGEAERANLVLLTLAGLAYPFALRELLRALGRDERLALFGAPALWNRALVWGFMPYVASVPVVVYATALAVKQEGEPTRRRGVALALLTLALFYLHADAYLLWLVIALGLALVGRRPDRAALLSLPRRLAYVVPSGVLAVGWALWGNVARRPLVGGGEIAVRPAAETLHDLPMWAHDTFRSHVDEALTVAFWAALLALLFVRRSPAGPSARERMALVPIFAAALVYLVLPWRMGAGVMLNVRLAVFVILFAPLLLRPAPGRVTSFLLAAVACVSLLVGADAVREIRAAEAEEIGDLDRLLDRMPFGANVLELSFRKTSRASHWMVWQFMGAYHRSRRGGVSSYTFSELVHWPLQFRPGMAPPSKAEFVWTRDSCLYRNEVDGPYYDYVLVRGDVEPFRDAPPGPRYVAVDRELDWVLYQREEGESWPAWPVPDEGPCESRLSLERRAATPVLAP